MTRPTDPSDVITLPRLDANAATVLAQSLEAATLDEKGKPRKLPESVKEALADVVADRQALREAIGAPPAPAPVVKEADLLEDNAIGTLSDLLKAWARLAGKHPLGDLAAQLHARLFADGLGFVNLTPREEWGVVQSKLDVLDNENLSPKLHQLGATPLLDHLREVHTHYGKVTGATQPTPPADSPELRAKYEALLTSLRHYIGAVLGSIIRRKPETRTLAETLLQPLTDWKTPRPRTRPTAENAPPGDKPPSPAGG